MRKLLITLVPAVLALGLGVGTAAAASPGVQSGGDGIPVKPTVCIIDPDGGLKKCGTIGATARSRSRPKNLDQIVENIGIALSTRVGASPKFNAFSITKKVDK